MDVVCADVCGLVCVDVVCVDWCVCGCSVCGCGVCECEALDTICMLIGVPFMCIHRWSYSVDTGNHVHLPVNFSLTRRVICRAFLLTSSGSRSDEVGGEGR